DLRPVPDNQEVFCHRVTDQSLIVELLELQAHDVGGVQEARVVQVEAVQPLLLENLALRGCCQEAWILSGKQQVAKENQQITRFSGKQEMGIYKPKAQMMFSLYLFPTPSPENRSSLGPENLSLPPWT
ncbi:hypothetical protein E2I00_019975, partial [Balaenoptera physalus]